MQAPSGQMTGPALQALLEDGALAGEWVLDPRRSSIRLKSKVMGLVRVNGVFREVSGHGTGNPARRRGAHQPGRLRPHLEI